MNDTELIGQGDCEMIQIVMKPELYQFDNCAAFAADFSLNESDLILSNEYIFKPYFENLHLQCHTVFQEKYGSGEPSDIMAEAILRDMESCACRRIIAIGGGTIIDLAKVIAVADTANVDELYEKMPNLKKRLELIIVPTTCGTGSEVTNIAVLNRTRIGTKMGLAAPTMYAEKAVMIPELLQGLPMSVFAASSIDALIHAVESSLSPKATSYTKLFSYKAIEMIIRGYQVIAERGFESRKELLSDFLTASNYAGLAFGTAGCGTVHAMAYPLGGQYHVSHGESNYALFICVMSEYLRNKTAGEILKLNDFLSELLECENAEVYEKLRELLDQILPHKALREYGVKEEDLPGWSKSVIENQQRLLKNSFIPMTENMILEIYESAY